MWVVHLMLTLAALYAVIIAGMFFAQTWLSFRPWSPERPGFSFPHQLSVSRSGRTTANALLEREFPLRERRPMPRRRCLASVERLAPAAVPFTKRSAVSPGRGVLSVTVGGSEASSR